MPDSEHSGDPEPYLIRGEWRKRSVPLWDERVERAALAVASLLDDWHAKLAEPCFEVLNSAGFQFRASPPTLFKVPLAVVRGRIPTLESSRVPRLPVLVVEVMVGRQTFGSLWERMHEYEAARVPQVWVLTPDFSVVTVHRLGATAVGLNVGDTISGDPDLPGFSARVADFFR